MKLTNKQHTDYCEIINNFKCKAIDILENLTKEYKDTLAEDIDAKLNDYKNHNEQLIIKINQLEQQLEEKSSYLESVVEADKVNYANYKKQLAEKDKEIDVLNRTIQRLSSEKERINDITDRFQSDLM